MSLFSFFDIKKPNNINSNNNINYAKNTKLENIPSSNLVFYFNEYLQSILLTFSYSENSIETDAKLNFWINNITVGESYNNLLDFEKNSATAIYYDGFLSTIWGNIIENSSKNQFQNFIKLAPDPEGGKVASLPLNINGINNIFPNYIDFKITDAVKERTLTDFFKAFNESFFNFYIKDSTGKAALEQSMYEFVTQNAINKSNEDNWWSEINNDLLPKIESIMITDKSDSIFNSLICSDMFSFNITTSISKFNIDNLNVIHNLNNIWLSLEQFTTSNKINQNSNLLSMYLIGIDNEDEPNQISFWTENNLNNYIGDPISNFNNWSVNLKGEDTNFNNFLKWIFNALHNNIQSEFLSSYVKMNPDYLLSDNIKYLIKETQKIMDDSLSPIYNKITNSLDKIVINFKINTNLINGIAQYNIAIINNIQKVERSLILTVNDVNKEKVNREEIDKNAMLINKFIDDFKIGLLINTNKFYSNQELLINTQYISNLSTDYNNFLSTLNKIFSVNKVININNMLWILWMILSLIGTSSFVYAIFYVYKTKRNHKVE